MMMFEVTFPLFLGASFSLFTFFFFGYVVVLLHRVLRLLNCKSAFAPASAPPTRVSRSFRRREQRELKKKRDQKVRCMKRSLRIMETAKKKKPGEYGESPFPIFNPILYLLGPLVQDIVSAQRSDNRLEGVTQCPDRKATAALSRFLSRSSLSLSVQRLAPATPSKDPVHDYYTLTSTTVCYQVDDELDVVRCIELALPQRLPLPTLISVSIHAHVHSLLPQFAKGRAPIWNVAGPCTENVTGIVSFGNATVSAASGQKRQWDEKEGGNRKKYKQLGGLSGNNIGGQDGNGDDDERQRQRPGRSHYKEDNDDDPLWGCPFYLMDPRRHWRCARKHDLKRYSDVKLHITRTHVFGGPHYCRECADIWPTEEPWRAHFRNNNGRCPCPGEAPSADNFAPDELTRLNNPPKGLSDLRKYRWMWETFFSRYEMPNSPYIHNDLREPAALYREAALQAFPNGLEGASLNASDILSVIEGFVLRSPPRFRYARPSATQGPPVQPSGPPLPPPSPGVDAAGGGPSAPGEPRPNPGPAATLDLPHHQTRSVPTPYPGAPLNTANQPMHVAVPRTHSQFAASGISSAQASQASVSQNLSHATFSGHGPATQPVLPNEPVMPPPMPVRRGFHDDPPRYEETPPTRPPAYQQSPPMDGIAASFDPGFMSANTHPLDLLGQNLDGSVEGLDLFPFDDPNIFGNFDAGSPGGLFNSDFAMADHNVGGPPPEGHGANAPDFSAEDVGDAAEAGEAAAGTVDPWLLDEAAQE